MASLGSVYISRSHDICVVGHIATGTLKSVTQNARFASPEKGLGLGLPEQHLAIAHRTFLSPTRTFGHHIYL